VAFAGKINTDVTVINTSSNSLTTFVKYDNKMDRPLETPHAVLPSVFVTSGFNELGSIAVKLPDGNTLSMNVTSQTDLSDFDDNFPEVGDRAKVEANANADGSFTAVKLSHEQPDDPDKNVITYQGLTTSAVGVDDVIHFKVGLKSYSYTIPSSADLEDFNGNAQAIQANQVVNVKVEFNESDGTVLKVGKASASPLEQSPQL
jgi:hypothetical protein